MKAWREALREVGAEGRFDVRMWLRNRSAAPGFVARCSIRWPPRADQACGAAMSPTRSTNKVISYTT